MDMTVQHVRGCLDHLENGISFTFPDDLPAGFDDLKALVSSSLLQRWVDDDLSSRLRIPRLNLTGIKVDARRMTITGAIPVDGDKVDAAFTFLAEESGETEESKDSEEPKGNPEEGEGAESGPDGRAKVDGFEFAVAIPPADAGHKPPVTRELGFLAKAGLHDPRLAYALRWGAEKDTPPKKKLTVRAGLSLPGGAEAAVVFSGELGFAKEQRTYSFDCRLPAERRPSAGAVAAALGIAGAEELPVGVVPEVTELHLVHDAKAGRTTIWPGAAQEAPEKESGKEDGGGADGEDGGGKKDVAKTAPSAPSWLIAVLHPDAEQPKKTEEPEESAEAADAAGPGTEPKKGAKKPGKPTLVLFSAFVPVKADEVRLSRFALLRGQIPESADLALTGVQLIAASRGLDEKGVADLNKELAELDPAPHPLPEDHTVRRGAALAAYLRLGDEDKAVVLRLPGKAKDADKGKPAAVSGAEPADKAGTDTSDQDTATKDDAPVLKVERALGPLHVRRLGLRYAKNRLSIEVDAAFTASGFSLEAIGLGLSVGLGADPRPGIVLEGLGAGYDRPPLQLSGTLVSKGETEDREFAYEGLVSVKAAKWGLMAVGSYERLKPKDGKDGYSSFFAYGALIGDLGGPPPINFTGLCAGFGYNSAVRVPKADEVSDFPFLAWLQSGDRTRLPGGDGSAAEPGKVLEKITGGEDSWVRPTNGQIWLAAGLSFDVAKIVQVSALALLEFGDGITIALLGRCSVAYPEQSPYLNIVLGFRALYQSATGELAITAALADDSWLVSKDCKLTGGAAFCTWFAPSHYAGDFVYTIGGYHPDFRKPDHYPEVARLGFAWSISSAVTAKGEFYLAFTPAAAMIGGRLEVAYEAGGLRAWLTAYFDVLVQWAPLFFKARIGITIGASYTADLWLFKVTIRVEIGAHLELWGPPTGGRARLEVGPFSVTIGFGEPERSAPEPLEWEPFTRQLPAQPVQVNALEGLLTAPAGNGAPVSPEHWRVATDGFGFAARTAVPVTVLRSGSEDLTAAPHQVHIRPMGCAEVASACTVTVTKKGDAHPLPLAFGPLDRPGPEGRWRAAALTSAVPKALWGEPVAGAPALPGPADQLLPDRVTGLEVHVPAPARKGSRYDVPLDRLRALPRHYGVLPLPGGPARLPDGARPGEGPQSAHRTLGRTLAGLGVLSPGGC